MSRGLKLTRQRGQSSIELLTAIGMLMLVFIAVGLYAVERDAQGTEIKTYISTTSILESLRDNLNTLQAVGDGYYRHFTLPATVYGNEEYNITSGGNVLEINWGNRRSWSTVTSADNASIRCLNKGGDSQNRAVNIKGRIYVAGGSEDMFLSGETFSNMSNASYVKDSSYMAQNGSWTIKSGRLDGDFLINGLGTASFGIPQEDYTLEGDVLVINSTGGFAGLIVRKSNDTYVSVELDPLNGTVSVSSVVDNVSSKISSVPYALNLNQWYFVRAQAYADELTVSIDCQQIMVESVPQTKGNIGVTAAMANAEFDNIQEWGYRR
ncbi:Uncharacterised protein [uncultured archaeon]|nr:Uncharacterised protein [uncultured archaeon]